jgi:hypothetical protein
MNLDLGAQQGGEGTRSTNKHRQPPVRGAGCHVVSQSLAQTLEVHFQLLQLCRLKLVRNVIGS